MLSNNDLCWACLASSRTRSRGKGCKVCSPQPPKKSKIPRPSNTGRPRNMVSLAATTMTQLCLATMNQTRSMPTLDILGMARDSPQPPPPEQEIPTMTIVVSRPNTSSVVVPSITLTAADGDWPTMDFDTFNKMGGREIRQSNDIRIVLVIERDPKRRHPKEKGTQCHKCCDAALANGHFAEAMMKDETDEVKENRQDPVQKSRVDSEGIYAAVEIEEKGRDTVQESRVDSQGSEGTGSTEDCKDKTKEDRELDSENTRTR